MWICPLCKSPLLPVANTWRCEHQHSYDRASEGYVNLLLANQKHSKEPGDNRQMMDARRQFLEQGFYDALGSAIALTIAGLSRGEILTLYDAGCGEGYFLNLITQDLRQRGLTVTARGSDISKSAIKMAARRYRQCHFAVASNFNLPVAAASQDFLLQNFAPADPAEVDRVLTSDGFWIQVRPGPQHLFQLRQALYVEGEPHAPDADLPAGFTLQHEQSVQFEVQLSHSSLEQLVKMTPYAWSGGSRTVSVQPENLQTLSVDFSIRVLQKN
ncbi:MAG: hypothetical protein RLZZ385_1175 [Pseudomonadota bacterium]|jgi:23S rRNA (guanine745-N1)-methyltransferase